MPPYTDGREDQIRTLSRGDYFGEQALLKTDLRTANVVADSDDVECLSLDREHFFQARYITRANGSLCHLQRYQSKPFHFTNSLWASWMN